MNLTRTVKDNPNSCVLLLLASIGTILGLITILTPFRYCIYGYGLCLSLKWVAIVCVIAGFFSDKNRKLLYCAGASYGAFYLTKFLIVAMFVTPVSSNEQPMLMAPEPHQLLKKADPKNE